MLGVYSWFCIDLTVLRSPEDMESALASCLAAIALLVDGEGRHTLSGHHDDDASPCAYIWPLKPCLLDTIHDFYLEALPWLPKAATRRHLHDALVA